MEKLNFNRWKNTNNVTDWFTSIQNQESFHPVILVLIKEIKKSWN